jgi:hypothetical protein
MTPEKKIGETRYSWGVCGHTIGLSASHIVGEIKEYKLNYLHYLSKEDGNITAGTRTGSGLQEK